MGAITCTQGDEFMKKVSMLKSLLVMMTGSMALAGASMASEVPDNGLSKDNPTQIHVSTGRNVGDTSIRRLMMMIDQTLQPQLQSYAFHSDSEELRASIVRDASRFLNQLYVLHQLVGDTSDQAYQVSCDASPEDVKNGRVILNVKVAPEKGGEFVAMHWGLSVLGAE
jgi:hypothetical protein